MSAEQVIAQTPKKVRVKKPKSKTRKILEWVLFGVFGAAAAVVLAGNISGMIHQKENFGQSIRFGVGNFIVLTESMEPEIPKDAAIITFKENVESFVARFEKGETVDITFQGERPTTHNDFVPDTPKFRPENMGKATYPDYAVPITHRLREVHVYPEIEYGKGKYVFVAAGINTEGDLSKQGQYQYFTEAEYFGVVKISNLVLGKIFSFVSSPIGLIVLLLVPAMYLIIASGIDIYKSLNAAEAQQAASTGNAKLDGLSEADRERLKKELLDEMIASKKGKKDEE